MKKRNSFLKPMLSTVMLSIVVGATLVGGQSQAASGHRAGHADGRSEQAPAYAGRYGHPPLIGREPAIDAPVSQDLGDRKDAAVLVGLYDAMRAAGLLDPKRYPASPDVATLEKVYEDAVASKVIDPSTRSPMVDIDRLQSRAYGRDIVAGGVPTKITTACAASAASCAAGTAGGILACAAAVETLGGLSAACVLTLAGAGAACVTASNNCLNPPRQEYDFLTSASGGTVQSTDVIQNVSCRDNQRVDGMTAYWAAHDGTTSIRSIVIHCTDGQTFS
ncbi:MAG: hypothetical protein ACTHOH_05170, partial [Lysobacteraceae bacterium]